MTQNIQKSEQNPHAATSRNSRQFSQRPAPAGYEVIALAGLGAFSETWQIRDRDASRFYALKRLRPEWRDEWTAQQLLRNEARVGQSVASGYIVQVVCTADDDGSPYTILEWLDGTTLEQALADEPRLSEGRALWIARQCANGLQDLAAAGFAHGDVKPSNIMLARQEGVTLIDLGFARSLMTTRLPLERPAMTGTAHYLAPEVLSRAEFSPIANDVYSLGITLYRMLAGRLPFDAANTADVLRLQRQAKPIDLRLRRPELSQGVSDLVNRMLAKQPIRRHQSYQGLVRELIALELASMPERFVVPPPAEFWDEMSASRIATRAEAAAS